MPKHITVNSSIDLILPDQTGNSGKYLKTDGTVATRDSPTGAGPTGPTGPTGATGAGGATIVKLTGDGQSIYWKRMGKVATNNEVLFV